MWYRPGVFCQAENAQQGPNAGRQHLSEVGSWKCCALDEHDPMPERGHPQREGCTSRPSADDADIGVDARHLATP
jgi:hypothetical protein